MKEDIQGAIDILDSLMFQSQVQLSDDTIRKLDAVKQQLRKQLEKDSQTGEEIKD